MARTLLGVRAGVAVACVLAIVWSAAPAVSGEGGDPFTGSVSRIDPNTRRLMVGSSWHAGCPTPLRDLRLVRVTYRGFDDRPRHGRLAVHRRWADEILVVFRRLYREGFPIRRVRLVDRFDADDRESMRHDNTSAFNCRYVAGTTTWSQHAFGRAIDINPVENPYVDGSTSRPGVAGTSTGRTFAGDDRAGGRAAAFRRIGWGWGDWSSAKDYQHFSANGH
jgi:poly-gamma-glutamate synthesis protein (capsule biosynthesis protein)